MDGDAIYRVVFGKDVQPDDWQLALTTDAWPRVLIAPTGSGKTAAVTLGWAAHRLRNPETTPRRLVWCLPMRTLVEQTALVVRDWFEKLAEEVDGAGRLPRPQDVHLLMGGVNSNDWLETPERPAVLVGTQDMLLSRALMRGYASSRAIWPMEFALLHEGTQWVFDEVQLMGSGRATSAQLEAFRQAETGRARHEGRPVDNPSRSLWISATLDPQWLVTVDHPAPESVVRVDPNTAPDGRLARLSRAPKRLSRSQVAPQSAKQNDLKRYIKLLADTVLDTHRLGFMTLAIVNRVDRAQQLHKALNEKFSKRRSATPTLALVHSRFRPADRQREMDKVVAASDKHPNGRIVVATQAVEAGVDISAAVMFTELAPWSSLVQRFGRVNRYAELADGAQVYWVDLIQPTVDGAASEKDADALALPYAAEDLRSARERLSKLTDIAPARLPLPDDIEAPRRVIRRKDLDDLFDTDPDLTGFDVDVSPYIRDADDTDIRVFWRDLSAVADDPPRPRREELCAVSISAARAWLKAVQKKKIPVFQRDPQWRRRDGQAGTATPGWTPFRDDPWPGLVLLADCRAGGYREAVGFTGDPEDIPEPIIDANAQPGASAVGDGAATMASDETEGHDEDSLSQIGKPVPLAEHLRHVSREAESLCDALGVEESIRAAVVRAARWHDLGKAHHVFQDTMRRGLDGQDIAPGVLLAKTVKWSRHKRAYFRHELASALAFLAHEGWSRDVDLTAYLIAAHHGKVRMNLRALPREAPPKDGDPAQARFARGLWEGDILPAFNLDGGEHWKGGNLCLSIMELGWDKTTRESWTERTRELLAQLGPFRLAWLETLLRVADWRASAKEREGGYDDR